jgi:hypothetical protein
MTISSNFYASKIFSEHPIAVYSLDDRVDYLSLINNDQRLFDSGGWSISNGTFDDNPELPDLGSPFISDIYSSVIGDVPNVNGFIIDWESPELFKLSDLNQQVGSFAMSMFLYQDSIYVNYYEVGYRFFDEFLQIDREFKTRVIATEEKGWINFNFSYLPPTFNDSQVKIFVTANVRPGGETSNEYRFIVNGISVGQNAEQTSSVSLGSSAIATPIEGLRGVPSSQYGAEEKPGFHIVENDNKILARNYGIPMVYGSDNCTTLYPASVEGDPSIIFPGYGFLQESGKYQEYTVEFWLKTFPNFVEEKRIFGPLNSNDGVYVNNNAISLVLGNTFQSHAISEWYRPMLIHVVIKENIAEILINGEVVISLKYDKQKITYEDSFDWLGFYSYKDVDIFEIDCFSIYSYAIPEIVAKKRFVWGQGVDSAENIAKSFSGESAFVNFGSANYDSNKTYPDTLNWNAGYKENLLSTRSSISAPEYPLPEVYIEGRDKDELFESNRQFLTTKDDVFFTFRPNFELGVDDTLGESWTEQRYLKYDSLNFVDDIAAFYGVFSSSDIVSNQLLAEIINSITGDTLSIRISLGKILYLYNDEIIYESKIEDIPNDLYNYSTSDNQYSYNYSTSDNQYSYSYPYPYPGPPEDNFRSYVVGIDIQKFIRNFDFPISNFFQSTESLQLYIGGNGEETFTERIYSFGFSNRQNYQAIKSYFDEKGFVDVSEYEFFVNFFATYSLTPLIRFNRFFLDISISAKWEEYFPLTMFSTFKRGSLGKSFYDLDYLQINFGYSSATEIIERILDGLGWTYQELFNEFNIPVQRAYEILDNALLTGYDDYDDLAANRQIERFLSAEQSGVRSYITFQLLSDGANRPLSRFPLKKNMNQFQFIDANQEGNEADPFRAYRTAFEFLDKTVVYPPRSIDIQQVAIVFHLEMQQRGILSHPLKIRDLEIASKSIDNNSFEPIGTESGLELYPYVRSGVYFDKNAQNPVLISKQNLPYLYLTSDSGIKVLGRQDTTREYGIFVPVNEQSVNDFSVGAMQIWMKYDFEEFSAVFYPIFEIESKNKTIEIVVRSNLLGDKGFVFARNKATRLPENNITFYQNGIMVKNPVLDLNQWTAIGISFDEPLDFDSFSGSINVFRGTTFNNVSYYKSEGLDQTSSAILRQWRSVWKDAFENSIDWEFWHNSEIDEILRTWRGVYVLSDFRFFAITPEQIYKSYTGTNRILVDDNLGVNFSSDSFLIFSDVIWSRQEQKPV